MNKLFLLCILSSVSFAEENCEIETTCPTLCNAESKDIFSPEACFKLGTHYKEIAQNNLASYKSRQSDYFSITSNYRDKDKSSVLDYVLTDMNQFKQQYKNSYNKSLLAFGKGCIMSTNLGEDDWISSFSSQKAHSVAKNCVEKAKMLLQESVMFFVEEVDLMFWHACNNPKNLRDEWAYCSLWGKDMEDKAKTITDNQKRILVLQSALRGYTTAYKYWKLDNAEGPYNRVRSEFCSLCETVDKTKLENSNSLQFDCGKCL